MREQDTKFRTAWEKSEDRKYLRPLAQTLHQFGAGGIGAFFEARNVPNLLARQTLKFPPVTWRPTSAVQTRALPPNQWQEEMIYLSQANFAAMQHYLVDFARGAWLGGALCDAEDSGCERLCYSQVSRLIISTLDKLLIMHRGFAARDTIPSVSCGCPSCSS